MQVLTAEELVQNSLIDINKTDECNKTAIINLDWGDENFEKLSVYILMSFYYEK